MIAVVGCSLWISRTGRQSAIASAGAAAAQKAASAGAAASELLPSFVLLLAVVLARPAARSRPGSVDRQATAAMAVCVVEAVGAAGSFRGAAVRIAAASVAGLAAVVTSGDEVGTRAAHIACVAAAALGMGWLQRYRERELFRLHSMRGSEVCRWLHSRSTRAMALARAVLVVPQAFRVIDAKTRALGHTSICKRIREFFRMHIQTRKLV